MCRTLSLNFRYYPVSFHHKAITNELVEKDWVYKPQHEKMSLISYGDKAGPDKSAQLSGLIRI